MCAAERINLVFFLFYSLMAFVRPLGWRQRGRILSFGAAGILIILCVRFLGGFLPPVALGVVRDWLPAPLMLVVYWQVGGFFRRPDEKIQGELLAMDRRVLRWLQSHAAVLLGSRLLAGYLELMYLLCYPLIPLGLGILYARHLSRFADEYWSVVLPATYLCYATLPFFQTLPPRLLPQDGPPPLPRTNMRDMNLWLLGRASIQINTLPSAHVASTVAAALALVQIFPAAGAVFLFFALSIVLAVFLGRYHYVADSLLALLLVLFVVLFRFLVPYF